MAMLPFCGYHMGDYFAHWLDIPESTTPDRLPKIFAVNWFRKGADGKFLWPGFGENSRVLKWIFERTEDAAAAVETPIGGLPAPGALDVSGLDLAPEVLEELFRVDTSEWLREAKSIREYHARFGEHLPHELAEEMEALEVRLDRA
jgi:phosphoenolpyruvate carboxykinase (GTP)